MTVQYLHHTRSRFYVFISPLFLLIMLLFYKQNIVQCLHRTIYKGPFRTKAKYTQYILKTLIFCTHNNDLNVEVFTCTPNSHFAGCYLRMPSLWSKKIMHIFLF